MTIIWDGASYHRSTEVREYLAQVNEGLEEDEWKITCIRLAANAPEQNPVEDVWLQAKQFIWRMARMCKMFRSTKLLFDLFINFQTFD